MYLVQYCSTLCTNTRTGVFPLNALFLLHYYELHVHVPCDTVKLLSVNTVVPLIPDPYP